MSQIPEMLRMLKRTYPANDFSSAHKSPFEVLVACILSLRTKDETTYPAAQRLFAKADTPRKMLRLSAREIEKAIYPVGFYRRKAKTIRGICKKVIRDYDSEVPDSIDELLKFKGVGRKTANIVITFGFNKPGIAVDTHVHRISNRLGIARTKTPEETEYALKGIVPREYWIDLNELFVRHGQNTCRPISPFCSRCQIRKFCKRIGVTKSR
ncbi:endonuclease III [Candidatus Woesearchaeota archaeon]|nr:endonuclease III [Candidatus Woesearchaeota archaeon]